MLGPAREASRGEDEIRRSSVRAALTLAEHGRVLTAEYRAWKTKNPTRSWRPRSLERTVFFVEMTAGPSPTGVEDAAILCGDVLVTSAHPDKQPVSLRGRPESIDGREFTNVECIRGTYVRANSEERPHSSQPAGCNSRCS